MKKDLTYRKANIDDLSVIVDLLRKDELGKTRETTLEQCYIDAFYKIDKDSNQYLMVVEKGEEIIGTCHLTLMPSLTLRGSTRLQIEAIRIAEKYRGQKVGEWIMSSAIDYGKSQGASIVQLTTNKLRPRAKNFYERLGFKASHEGMKLYLK